MSGYLAPMWGRPLRVAPSHSRGSVFGQKQPLVRMGSGAVDGTENRFNSRHESSFAFRCIPSRRHALTQQTAR